MSLLCVLCTTYLNDDNRVYGAPTLILSCRLVRVILDEEKCVRAKGDLISEFFQASLAASAAASVSPRRRIQASELDRLRSRNSANANPRFSPGPTQRI